MNYTIWEISWTASKYVSFLFARLTNHRISLRMMRALSVRYVSMTIPKQAMKILQTVISVMANLNRKPPKMMRRMLIWCRFSVNRPYSTMHYDQIRLCANSSRPSRTQHRQPPPHSPTKLYVHSRRLSVANCPYRAFQMIPKPIPYAEPSNGMLCVGHWLNMNQSEFEHFQWEEKFASDEQS